MRFLKRVRLAVLFLIAVALMTGTSAPVYGAKPAPGPSLVLQLTPVAPEGDPDYDASGTATLSNITETGWEVYPYQGRMTVDCKNLTPGEQFIVFGWDFLGVFTANRKGAGGISGWTDFDPAYPLRVTVERLDEAPDGTYVPTMVLDGSFFND
jgi:hypothetical protein